jgi:hypothetical protein
MTPATSKSAAAPDGRSASTTGSIFSACAPYPSLWIEFLAGTKLDKSILNTIKKKDELCVPVICLYEVRKKFLNDIEKADLAIEIIKIWIICIILRRISLCRYSNRLFHHKTNIFHQPPCQLRKIFTILSQREAKIMATATETLTVTEVKQAMGVLKLGNWTDDLLDEIELDRELKISEEQEKKGLVIPLEEAEKIMRERFASGYYGKQ